ncbi:excisionase [Cupriavidus metallidurans]|uniref:excisionase n=1 Tax=Cupriavidus metallidurans TaxID=119219 RepID=UPI001CCAC5CF|nr:excisionase [Cupriavidus metallidurans]UBM11704.1 excisionase [Cupriavidus metallidurans]
MKWIKLKRYCELSGDTPAAVHSKRKKGNFLDGVHCQIAGDGNLWINVEAVERWVEQGDRATVSALRAG